jgi:hypothetical protein
LSVDPGINGCGISVFEDAELIQATYVPNRIDRGVNILARARAMALAVVSTALDAQAFLGEMPQIYAFGKGRGDPNDLLPLAAVLGGIVSAREFSEVRVVRPREWKGTIDPDALIERVKERLTPKEHSRVCLPSAASLQHNCWDAIGLSLFGCHRLERKRVFAR